MTYRVLLIDYSHFMREMLCCLIESDGDIEVVGMAGDFESSLKLKRQLQPDVILLDADLAGMHGRAFLEQIIEKQSAPVIMISSLTRRNVDISLRALEMGAFDVVTKSAATSREMSHLRQQLILQIKSASMVCKTLLPVNRSLFLQQAKLRSQSFQRQLIAIGASSGGVETLSFLMSQLPIGLPPILITQHLPEAFLAPMAERLNMHSAINVRPAQVGENLQSGHAYIANTTSQLGLSANGSLFVSANPHVTTHIEQRPSVDIMFYQAAKKMGERSMGIILTGTGKDGSEGLRAMRDAGACTLGQTPESSIASDMPSQAIERGAVQQEVALSALPQAIMELC